MAKTRAEKRRAQREREKEAASQPPQVNESTGSYSLAEADMSNAVEDFGNLMILAPVISTTTSRSRSKKSTYNTPDDYLLRLYKLADNHDYPVTGLALKHFLKDNSSGNPFTKQESRMILRATIDGPNVNTRAMVKDQGNYGPATEEERQRLRAVFFAIDEDKSRRDAKKKLPTSAQAKAIWAKCLRTAYEKPKMEKNVESDEKLGDV